MCTSSHPFKALLALSALGGAPVPALSDRAAEVSSVDLEKFKQMLMISPLSLRPDYSAPSLSPGVPSGFIAGWGDYFIFGNGSTPGARPDVDGGLSVGFGVGDAAKALELDLIITSINNFGQRGGFDAKLGLEGAKEATLLREVFVVVGSMENPPSNPSAVASAGDKG